ncbi:Hypothetical predicted protein [Mytilus galloprovincialis]|uniref:Uncharacterized protein n=1 Tax=Mytilus galloprovincialis TaxID=29158 RepID=A0A8B6BYU0_MYTGA|nr:Hypothetical predicted protein [Mytilus galloprovincialis]
MEFSSFWRFRLLTIFINIYLVNDGKCDCGSGMKECQYGGWSVWGSCNNNSVQTTKRIRPICCPPVITNYDACLKHCNITTNLLQTNEERKCIAILKKNNSKSSTGMIVGICFGILILLLIAAAVTLVLLHRFKKISLFTRLRAILHKDDDTKTETQPELKADSS